MTVDSGCPKCHSENAYNDGVLWVCPECAHEWNPATDSVVAAAADIGDGLVVKDAHGTRLSDGDSVTITKDLKVKGATTAVKVGTKVKSIRLVDGPDGHNISCRIDGFGAMHLKSEFVRKS